MRKHLKLAMLALSFLSSVSLFASDRAGSSTVSFTLDFPGANPSHYEIQVASDGHGSYSSNGQLTSDSQAADPVTLQFSLSDKVRQQIFDLSKRAQYFTGKVDSGRKNIANTGMKTLIYNDGKRTTQATYNYSLMPAIEQLTDLFQSLSTTLEFGRRLTFFHKYQKLALDDDLKRMEELAKTNSLGDVQAIAPVLESIGKDPTVMNITRARALRLLGPS
jgi:hypothetical protein